MNLSGPFIRRPVGTTLLTVALVLAGVIGFQLLPVAPLPQVDFPTINVSTGLPGASPLTMASAVATPLERQFTRIAAVSEMTSTSFLGSTSVALQFDLSRDINGAARDVQSAINAASGQLPSNLPSNPTYRKVNPADAPIMILALTSATATPGKLYDMASTILQQKLAQLDGVGQVFVGGSSLPAVRVELNPHALARYGIGLEDVRAVLASANVNRPKGQIHGPERAWEIRTSDQIRYAAEYRPLLVAWRNGAAVRLEDVADVRDSVEDLRSIGLANGQRAALLIIFRQPGANIIDAVDRIRAALPELHALLPADVALTPVLDQTVTIRASVADVEHALMISVALVVLVVFLFLRDWRATAIPGVVVPVSLIGTFAFMYLIGYSIDNLSLMALTVATGFVVDDAIVVVENVMRHLEAGMSPLEAAIQGAREIGFTVLSISISLVAVFIPILLMGGLIGRLFREFAVVLSVAILVSLVVSLTVTPMMCARLLRSRENTSHGRLYRGGERVFGWVTAGYEKSLGWALHYPRTVLLIAGLTCAVNVYLFVAIPKGFFPQQDNGRLSGSIVAAQDTSFQAMRDKVTRYAEIVRGDPAVATVTAYTGGGARGTTVNTARMFIALKPRRERDATADEVITRLRPKLARVAGATCYLQAVQDIRVGGRMGNAQYQYTLQADRLEDLSEWAPRMLQTLRALPELRDVSSDQQDAGLQVPLTIDRDTAARLGVSTRAHRRDALQRLRAAPGVHHLHPAQPVPGGDGGGARVLAEPRRPPQHPYPVGARGVRPPHRPHPLRAERGPAAGEPPGPLPVGDALVQPGPRGGPRRGGHRGGGRGAPHRAAREHPRQVRGRGPGLPGLAVHPAAPDPGRPRRGLHRARHAVRELRPPAHHPVHPALGRGGRAARAARVRDGAVDHRPDRHHPADRHREEERDHGHRRRARPRAARGPRPPRGHPRGLPAPAAAHPDDHHGRAAGRPAPGARHSAPAPSCAARWASASWAACC